MGKINIAFKDKLTVTVTIRVNGTINEMVKRKIPIGDDTVTVAVQSRKIRHDHAGVTSPRQ